MSPIRMQLLVALFALRGFASLSAATAFSATTPTPTSIPPLVDVPVWSLATLNEDGTTNFNILTYASPVSITPDRLYALGLYKETLSYENYCRENGSCVLQLLTPKHIPLVRLLGGQSGRDIGKEVECKNLSTDSEFELQDIGDNMPKVLPGCAQYLRMSPFGPSGASMIDGGSHEVVICKVDEMLLPSEDYVANSEEYLSTAKLRELGITTEQGRIAD